MLGLDALLGIGGKLIEKLIPDPEAKAAQEAAVAKGEPVPDYVSDAEYVMELMIIDRQIKQYYDDIKHIFTYYFQEAGMWDEFWERMGKLRADREAKAETLRRAEMERRLHEKAKAMKERRAKAKQEETIQTVLGVTVVLVLIIGFGYFMRWMFQQGG